MPKPFQLAVGQMSKKAIFKPEHQNCPQVDDKPRYWYLNPLQQPAGVWSGSEQYVDFEIDQNIGVAESIKLRLNVKYNGADVGTGTGPNGANGWYPALPPTPYWISRVEVYVGSDGPVETVYADSVWHETFSFLRDQEQKNVADIYNLNLNDVGGAKDLTAKNWYNPEEYTTANSGLPAGDQPISVISTTQFPSQTTSGYYYISLDATMLSAMRPYVRGFQSKFRIRVYFPSSIVSQYGLKVQGVAGTSAPVFYTAVQPSVSLVQMIVEEQQTDPASLAKLEMAHRAGIVDYTCAIRERFQDSPSILTGLTQNTSFLRAFRNKSAGLVCYLVHSNEANQSLTRRLAFQSWQLLDSRGNKITEILDNDVLTSYIFPSQINSSFPNSAPPDMRTVILLPFAKKFQPVYKDGCSYGNFQLTSLEQLILTPDNGTANTPLPNGEMSSVGSNTIITVVSYSYAHVTCVAGKHSIRYE